MQKQPPSNTDQFKEHFAIAQQLVILDDATTLSHIYEANLPSEKLLPLLRDSLERGKPRTGAYLLKRAMVEGGDLNPRLLVWAGFGGCASLAKAILNIPTLKTLLTSKIKEEALIRASGSGHVDMVKLLSSLVRGKEKRAEALCWASLNGHTDVVKFLIKKTDPTYDGSRALQWAFQGGHRQCIDMLLFVSDVEEATVALHKKWGTDPQVLRELKSYTERGLIGQAIQQQQQRKSQSISVRKM